VISLISQLELQDLHYRVKVCAPNELVTFLAGLAKIRKMVAHMEVCPVALIKSASGFWDYIDTYLPDTLHGWDWPSCGQTLTMMVGPSGAGKSFYARQNFPADAIISSDQIRQEWYGTLENTTAHDILFRHILQQAITALRRGRSVLIDATHLIQRERMMTVGIVPPHVPITYIVIDRPMKEKELSQGWRESRPGLLQKHEATFQRELPAILAGDCLKNVTVENRIKN
jgi:predicted kinase